MGRLRLASILAAFVIGMAGLLVVGAMYALLALGAALYVYDLIQRSW